MLKTLLLCCQWLITKSSVEEVVLQPAVTKTIDKVNFKRVNCLRNEKEILHKTSEIIWSGKTM